MMKVCDLTGGYVLECNEDGNPFLWHSKIEGNLSLRCVKELISIKEWYELVEQWQVNNEPLRSVGDLRYRAASRACQIWKGMLNEKADSLSLEIFTENEISIAIPRFCAFCKEQIENNQQIQIRTRGKFVINKQLDSIAIVDTDTYLLCSNCIGRH